MVCLLKFVNWFVDFGCGRCVCWMRLLNGLFVFCLLSVMLLSCGLFLVLRILVWFLFLNYRCRNSVCVIRLVMLVDYFFVFFGVFL